MFVKNLTSGDLAQVDDMVQLTDPYTKTVMLHYFAGEEMGDTFSANKDDFVFPSGEKLPKCWVDPHYRMSF